MRMILAALALSLSTLPAQLFTGDIAATAFSINDFALIDPSGTPMTVNIGNFGGGTSQAILWDPAQPDSVIVGGFAFVGRVDFSTGTPVYSVITTSVGTACQMSWDNSGNIIVADAGSDSVLSVNPTTGAVNTIVASGPWGSTMNAGVFDQNTGDIYIGNNGSVYRIPAGGTPVLFASGWTTGTSYVSGLQIAPSTGEVCATLLSVNRVVRFDALGNATDLTPPSSVTSPNALSFEATGDLLVGGSQRRVYRIAAGSTTATLVSTFAASGGSCSGVSAVGLATPPAPGEYQTNSPEATLLLDGAIGTAAAPAAVSIPLNGMATYTLSSSLPGGASFDVGIGVAPLLPRSGGGYSLINGDVVNLDLGDPAFFFLNNGFMSATFLTNLTGTLTAAVPTRLSFQMIIFDPSTAGGFRLSQPTTFEAN